MRSILKHTARDEWTNSGRCCEVRNNKRNTITGCNTIRSFKMFHRIFAISAFVLICLMVHPSIAQSNKQWYRGSMHTHSFWEGGRDFPENIAKWYKDSGYNFVVFTEHDVIQEGMKWVPLPESHSSIIKYQNNFGKEWVEMVCDESIRSSDLPRFIIGDQPYVRVRVKSIDEYRSKFEEPNQFLVMKGQEITDHQAVHLLAFHVDELMKKSGGEIDERGRMIKDNVAYVDEYRKRTGRNFYPVLAHPNYNWAITAEMIIDAGDLRFFEVYNGVPESNNNGDDMRPGTDRIWDIVLAHRLENNHGNIIYGLATDDAHDYDSGINGRNVGLGKGWVMVRSETLSPNAILDALDHGDFYSSTGVILKNLQFDGTTLTVEIDPKEEEKYTVEYIGTRRNFDKESKPAIDADGNSLPNSTRIYSNQVGQRFKQTSDIKSNYSFTGNELYVRVRIVSTAVQIDAFTNEVIGTQKAWVQPVTYNLNP